MWDPTGRRFDTLNPVALHLQVVRLQDALMSLAISRTKRPNPAAKHAG